MNLIAKYSLLVLGALGVGTGVVTPTFLYLNLKNSNENLSKEYKKLLDSKEKEINEIKEDSKNKIDSSIKEKRDAYNEYLDLQKKVERQEKANLELRSRFFNAGREILDYVNNKSVIKRSHPNLYGEMTKKAELLFKNSLKYS